MGLQFRADDFQIPQQRQALFVVSNGMRTLHILISTLIFLTFIILIGFGHGVAPMGLMELYLIPSLFSSNILSSDSGEVIFLIFMICALVGHILLILSFRRKNLRTKFSFILLGQLLLLCTIIFLTKDFRFNSAARFTLGFSIPALLNMGILTIYLFYSKKNWLTQKQ